MIDVRERVTDSGLRRRAARQAKRSLRPLIVVIATLGIGLACAIYLLLHIDKTALVSSSTYSFQVANANAVQPGVDEVRFKGIPAGKITSVSLQGTQPVITVDLESSFGPVYRNATARLRPNTPLQDMYLNITSRGTPSAGLASTTRQVPADQTSTAVSVSDVLNVFAGNERARLAQLLAAFGNGLADRGLALRTSFAELVPFVTQAGRITAQLNLHSGLTKQLIHNTGVLTTALGQRAQQIRLLVADGSRVAGTLGANSPALEQTLAALPPTISIADSALSALSGVLPSVNGAVASLYPVADRLPRALADIRTLTAVAQPAVIALRTPVAHLVPLARVLAPVSSNLSASVHTLLPQVPALTRTISDVGNCLPSLYGFFAWDASMAKFGDARGAAPRGNAVAGAQTLGIKNGFEFAPQACTPGTAIGGRLPQAGDYH
jgi:phospholipid/cholesterol/gamma-HCH transport system substrate-binding protein